MILISCQEKGALELVEGWTALFKSNLRIFFSKVLGRTWQESRKDNQIIDRISLVPTYPLICFSWGMSCSLRCHVRRKFQHMQCLILSLQVMKCKSRLLSALLYFLLFCFCKSRLVFYRCFCLRLKHWQEKWKCFSLLCVHAVVWRMGLLHWEGFTWRQGS